MRAIALAGLAIALAWEITTRSVEAWLARPAPEVALLPQPGDAGDEARAWAEEVLQRDPLNARALRILGQLAEAKGDAALASRLMQAAARRSLRESAAIYWLFRQSWEREDFATAAHYADILMRTRPGAIDSVTPALARMAETRSGSSGLKRLLESNPPWRAQFFRRFTSHISDARTPLELFLSLKDTTAPPTSIELKNYLDFLISKKLYELSYYTWLQFLPEYYIGGLGNLFNGSFETPPSGAPFDWSIEQGKGVTVDIAARPDQEDKRALFIEFGYGRVEFRPVRQLVALAPGVYRFSGGRMGEITGKRGLQWRVACAENMSAPLGQSLIPSGASRAWSTFEFTFTVPDKNCRAQYVSLTLDARSASEQFVSGSVWCGDLAITRLKRDAP